MKRKQKKEKVLTDWHRSQVEHIKQLYLEPEFGHNVFEIITAIRYDPELSSNTIFDEDEDEFLASLTTYNTQETSGNTVDNDQIQWSDLINSSNSESFMSSGLNETTQSTEIDAYIESNYVVVDAIEESNFFLYNEHWNRLQFSMEYFNWNFVIPRELLLGKLKEAMSSYDLTTPYKIRVSVNNTGRVDVVPTPTTRRTNLFDGFDFHSEPTDSDMWKVYINREPILVSPFTSFKTTKRDQYNKAREASLDNSLPMGSPQEVLLYNSAGQVTEGSITNVAFLRKKTEENGEICERWVTPPLSSGCLCGVVRHALLCKNLIEEDVVPLKEVEIGEEVLLFNAIMGVVRGIIVQRKEKS
ncbi:aminodeoxychorismate lyase ABZ2 [Ascoidea rubescens DSM 1968]|uniref:D-aminoacid aminotransferase-like PLP-dependent enzyme n=1 Tax=Ascoidea rubescens DSM 1968 TaxID=1344418 RepID=A0A1D2VPR6_9ASCO|nr:D-aminoacid aminotransferase-like PLP-dependent enzyme [Ascoidea rubescens DSM 1968]ODV63596.1 D-aminoacid aminotransferase-like PLP-dependent enzyme [Ascoidea rubescens DSM 1968]